MTPEQQMDTIDFIMLVEEGRFDPANASHVKSLQSLIDSGLVWQLQGAWQRFAKTMIEIGIVS